MYDDEKIYSIELGEDLEITTPPKELKVAVPASRARPRSVRAAAKPQPRTESKPPSGGLQFAPLMILTYLLGPFSVHLNPDNKKRKGLLTAGMISGMAVLGMFAGRSFILDLIGKGWPLWPWAMAGMVVTLIAFSVWSRSVYLTGSRHRVPRHKLPSMLRRPWAVGIAGLFAPGLGLMLAGCPGRGAAVTWLAWPVAAAVLVLAHGLQIWGRNQGAGGVSIQPVVLETIFLAAAGTLVVGLIGWVAQALEGARQMMGEPGIRHRMRGDWYAAALFVTLLSVAVVWDPTSAARQLNSGSVILREQGFQVIPLHMARSARRLDPGPTEYAVGIIELCEELGRRNEAVQVRRELEENLSSYLTLVQTENRSLAMNQNRGRSPEQDWNFSRDKFGQAGPHGPDRPFYQAR